MKNPEQSAFTEIEEVVLTFDKESSQIEKFIKLVEFFLPKIDNSDYGQSLAEIIFSILLFDEIVSPEVGQIKTLLGTLEVPNSEEYVNKTKKLILDKIRELT